MFCSTYDSGFSAAEALYGDPLGSSWTLMNSLQYSRTGSSLLCVVWCCLLLITVLLLLLEFPVLWPWLNMCLFVRTPLSDLSLSSTLVPVRSYLTPASFLLYR